MGRVFGALTALAQAGIPIDAMDRRAERQLSQAMALGWIDGWPVKPWEPAEEFLYLPVTEQLTYWARATGQPGLRGLADRRAAVERAQPRAPRPVGPQRRPLPVPSPRR